jgi:DNA-binding beta-propeller fold protein YncE
VRPEGEVDVVAEGLRSTRGIAPAADGSIYVSDKFGSRVLRLTAAGAVDVIAGTGRSGFAGDRGPANVALLAGPTGLAASADGSLYIADTGNHRVRVIDADGRIRTVVGSGLKGFSGDLGPALEASLSSPMALALRNGQLYVADSGNSRIRVIKSDGTIETIVGAPTTRQ